MLIKKINVVLCILLALIVLGQLYMVTFEPYYLMTETTAEFSVKEADAGQVPYPHEIGLFEMIWLKFHDSAAVIGEEYGGFGDNLTASLAELGEFDEYKSPELGFEKKTNFYVMGIVGVTVLGLVVVIMTIFTRKSIVQYCFTLAWCAVSIWAFFNSNPIIQSPEIVMPYGLGTVLPTLKLLSIAGCVVTALRAYPFVYTRFIAKKDKK